MTEPKLRSIVSREIRRALRRAQPWIPDIGRPGRLSGEEGMSTAEYAVGTIAAAAFAAVLYAVVTGDSVTSGLTELVQRALSASF